MPIDVDDLYRQVAADGLCGIGTLLRRYDADEQEICDAVAAISGLITTKVVTPVETQRSTRGPYRFVHLKRRYRNREEPTLCHLAGVAEMRLRLGAQPGNWFHVNPQLPPTSFLPTSAPPGETRQYNPMFRRGESRPDAIWAIGGQEHLVEYDRGTYTSKQCHLKIASMVDRHRRLYWGDPSDKRKALVQQQFLKYLDHDRDSDGNLPADLDTWLASEPFITVPTYWHVRSEADL